MKIKTKIKDFVEQSREWTEAFSDMSEKRDLPRERLRREEHMLDRILEEKAEHMGLLRWRRLYLILAAVCAVILIGVLLVTVSMLPAFGEHHEHMDTVAQYYIERTLEDTGAMNIVAGMILDYRAFDTLGESFVLFTALNCVLILLRRDYPEEYHLSDYYDLTKDPILRRIGMVVIPCVVAFGVYVMLNGHLSPGGGFSGGAIIGAGLILLSCAFGDDFAAKVVSERLFKWGAAIALGFYCVAKSYSFYTGANHLESGISQGMPGNIFSGGLILPLNVAVGFVVTLTMYGIYRMFRKGSF